MFLQRIDWLAFWCATLPAAVIYIITLAPTVTLEDSGELAVAGDHLGVPHPPGYPIWTMIAWLFARLFRFVTFQGQPNPAWSIGLVSAVFGALAAGITAMLVCRSGRDILRHTHDTLHQRNDKQQRLLAWLGGVVGSLSFAFSPAMWSQSTIVEVYSLNAFFLMLILLLCYRWICKADDRSLLLMAFIFGLGLTNYQVLLLAAGPIAVMILIRDQALLRDLLVAATPTLLLVVGIATERLPGIAHPLSQQAAIYVAINLLSLLLAYFCLPRGRCAALTIFMAQLGVAFYAYMPLVSDLRNPPMNWAYPRTWDGFVHAITREQYAALTPTNILSGRFLEQLGAYFSDLRGQFTLPVALLGFLPFSAWQLHIGKRRRSGLDLAIALAAATIILLAIHQLLPAVGLSAPLRIDKIPAGALLLLTGLGLVILVLTRLIRFWRCAHEHASQRRWTEALLLWSTLLAFAACALGYVAVIVKKIRIAQLAEHAADANLIPLLLALIALPALVIFLTALCMRSTSRLRLTFDDATQTWLTTTGLGFLILSAFLIVLANPKGDVQDNFIQRVKFISSHALFAVWIGYGLMLTLARLCSRWPNIRSATLTLIGLTIVFIPIAQNVWNPRLVALSGGSEQNGHDFGWQFGNYALRGAEAIAEELNDEEPLPNPTYPPSMDSDAVFFGGTDPGRFVPTYMIYSADVRPDVYLITQNALADTTYLNVMRDLYGDNIWIPSAHDSEYAFNTYAIEVKQGKRSPNAQITIENGRVQVRGILGVMEINGILANMIFDREAPRRSFYVEESYPIPWMYPRLSPHGLILQLNQDAGGIETERVRNDQDFWDWYTRRLHSSTRFQRDIVARKSFSKLRSAIAGVYAEHGQHTEAEMAFTEAMLLYPYSPEATFRLAQSVLIPQKRYDDAEFTLRRFIARDPRNATASRMLVQLERVNQLSRSMQTMESAHKQNTLNIDDIIKLAALQFQFNNLDRYHAILDKLVTHPDTPVLTVLKAGMVHHGFKQFAEMHTAFQVFEARVGKDAVPADYRMRIANMYADAKMLDLALVHMKSAVEQQSDNWRGWLDIALLYQTQQKPDAAYEALRQAFAIGGTDARNAITERPQLLKLAAQPR
ncbi:MAG: tetratricopeptide (TPR) repeat protein [Candidatus Promineifilaceae bacterium]